MYLIDRISYTNRFIDVHPVEKMFFSMGGLVLSVITGNPALLVSLFIVMSILIVFAAGVKLKHYIKLLAIPFIFIILGVITIIVEINAQPGEYLWRSEFRYINFSISNDSASIGGILFLRSITSISCFYFFILTTPVSDVEYILKTMRLPVLFREMFMMIYRFIFITAEMAERIKISQRSRSGYSSFKKSIKSTGMLASSVFVKSFFFGKASYSAMLSRGYEGELNVLDSDYRFSAVNIVMIVLFHLCFISLIIRFG